jgi:diguanylate cyclase (GGDEF)-like protein
VTGQVFISLLNPGIGLLLAAAFFMLWYNQRHQTYILIASISYLLMIVGFLLQDVVPSLPHDFNRVPSNFSFLLAAMTMAMAILQRYRVPVPHLLMAIIIAVGMAGQVWFLWISPNIAIRIYFVSSSLGAIFLLIAIRLYRVEKPHLIDHLLLWTVSAAAANFILRPLLIAWLVGLQGDAENFQHSIYWTTVQFTQAMMSIMVALTLMVSVAIDLMNELRQRANTDQLSGLLNRRGFEEQAAEALRISALHERSVVLLIADIDHFKHINDTYGHAVGDKVISMFGNLVALTAGAGSVAGRIGGEEFAILIPGADVGAGRAYAERLRNDLPATSGAQLPAELRPTISLGLHVDSCRVSLHELLASADAALYEAKRSGRDRVSVFKPGVPLVIDNAPSIRPDLKLSKSCV